MHSGIVPLSGDGGHVAEVAPQLLNALTARHVQPIRLAVAGGQTETQEEVRPNERVSLCAEPKGICSHLSIHLSMYLNIIEQSLLTHAKKNNKHIIK